MKSGSLLAAALVSSLAVAGGSVSAYPTNQDQNALRVEARAELAR